MTRQPRADAEELDRSTRVQLARGLLLMAAGLGLMVIAYVWHRLG